MSKKVAKMPWDDPSAKIGTQLLNCSLTDAELSERSQDLARAQGDLEAADEQRKLDAKRHAEILSRAKQQVAHLARVVRERAELRVVATAELRVFEENAVITYRTDTGEVYTKRAMTASERQLELVNVPPPVDPPTTSAPAPSERPKRSRKKKKSTDDPIPLDASADDGF